MRFLPTDNRYFDLLDDLSSKANDSCRLLSELVQSPQRRSDLVKRIKEVEQESDEITESINERLDRTFITPIDREDIHAIAARLDHVVDLVDGTARRFVVFDVDQVPAEAKPLADILTRTARKLENAVSQMRNPKMLSLELKAVKQFEAEGDEVYETALTRLFRSQPDPLYAIEWKEIYDRMEDAIDECQHVAQVLASVALKNR